MWKRDEGVLPAGETAVAPNSAPAAARPTGGAANIGKSVVIKGELVASEDLTVDGQVEGKIELRQNVLTIGGTGKVKAQVFAKTVIVLGDVAGNVTATEKVDIKEKSSVEGDLVAPRVAIAEGAHFRGSIDMQKGSGSSTSARSAAADKSSASASSGVPAHAGAQAGPGGQR